MLTASRTQTETDTILLVDDNTTNLQILRETLDGQGYKLLIAKNVLGCSGPRTLRLSGSNSSPIVMASS